MTFKSGSMKISTLQQIAHVRWWLADEGSQEGDVRLQVEDVRKGLNEIIDLGGS